MARPTNVKYILAIISLKLFAMISLVICAGYTLFNPSHHNIFTSIGRMVIYASDAEKPFLDPHYTLGGLWGYYLIPFLTALVMALQLMSRKRIGFWIACILEIIFSLGAVLAIPLLSIGILILALTPQVKVYFKKPQVEGS